MNAPKLIAAGLTSLIVIGATLFILDINPFEIKVDWPQGSNAPTEENGHRTKSKTSTSVKPARKSSTVAKAIDKYKGVEIYDNGKVRNTFGRNVTDDGYNLGLKYQCVEFVKRFYYEYFDHKMPDSYGNAKDFYNSGLSQGGFNTARGLNQFRNKGNVAPKVNDILVFGPTPYNRFGHVAVVSKVKASSIEMVQQNAGPGNPSRESIPLMTDGKVWKVDDPYLLGWLRMP